MAWVELDGVEEREPVTGYRVRLVHTENMTFAYWRVEEGAVLPAHQHPHEQVMHVLEGRFELEVAGDRRVLEPGMVAVVPPGAVHAGRALTACKLLDAFWPVREDYR